MSSSVFDSSFKKMAVELSYARGSVKFQFIKGLLFPSENSWPNFLLKKLSIFKVNKLSYGLIMINGEDYEFKE